MRRVLQVSRSATPVEVAELAARMAREAMTVETRLLALRALRGHWPDVMRGGDDRAAAAGYVQALGSWARSVAFVREPLAVGEVVMAPWRVVRYGAGDCDDLACAVTAFAAVVGLPAAVSVYASGEGAAHAVALVGDSWRRPGGLTHVIDHKGARVAPLDILAESLVTVPVSRGL